MISRQQNDGNGGKMNKQQIFVSLHPIFGDIMAHVLRLPHTKQILN